MAQWPRMTTPLQRALLWIGALSLVLGGIVIANLMFAAAAARSREIGTQRAVGASRSDVLGQFQEAVTVSVVSAIAGTVLAAGWALIGTRFLHKALVLEWPTTLATIFAAGAIGSTPDTSGPACRDRATRGGPEACGVMVSGSRSGWWRGVRFVPSSPRSGSR